MLVQGFKGILLAGLHWVYTGFIGDFTKDVTGYRRIREFLIRVEELVFQVRGSWCAGFGVQGLGVREG